MSIALIIVVLLSYIVQGMCCFGANLIISSYLSFFTINVNITPLTLMIIWPSNAIIAWKERKGISLNIAIPLSLIGIFGSIVGAYILKNGNASLIKIFFSILIIGLSIQMFFQERMEEIRSTPKSIVMAMGVVASVINGLYGIGAFLIPYINLTTKDKTQRRGNLAFVFFVTAIFRIWIYYKMEILNIDILKTALTLMPSMLIGVLIGIRLCNVVSDKLLKRVTLGVLFFSGISLAIINILTL